MITIRRGLLADCLSLLDASKQDRYTVGEASRVFLMLQHELERTARGGVPDGPAGGEDAG